MVVDFDDFYDGNDRLDLLLELKAANPLFRCTLFAVPALSSQAFWDSIPDWCELAMHGWLHPHPREAEHWTYEEALDVMLSAPAGFVEGWKSPGWMISDGTYKAAMDLGWWVADHPDNILRRPNGLRVHVVGDGDHFHGHIQDVCGNGIQESWDVLLPRVKAAKSFEFVSESVREWAHQRVAA